MIRPPQQEYANQLIAHWSGFARTGTTPWPRTHPLDRTVQSITATGTTKTDFITGHRVTFWRSLAG